MGVIRATYDAVWAFLYKMASPRHFHRLASRLIPWIGAAALLLFVHGLYGAFTAPADYQQGESYRIIFIHVPSAWMSMFVYVFMAFCAGVHLIWRLKLADVMAACSAPLGASFTFLALVTGSLWGKPMWGSWWEWDARLTSELILLFLYLGAMALRAAIDDARTAGRAVAVLVLVGVVNIPIIHYSVEWWNTLHQPASITKFDKPSMHISMLVPLLELALAFQLYFFATLLMRARNEVVNREWQSNWVRELVSRP